jgi:hypothetical protein
MVLDEMLLAPCRYHCSAFRQIPWIRALGSFSFFSPILSSAGSRELAKEGPRISGGVVGVSRLASGSLC